MSKTGYLVKNTGILAVGSLSAKAITFLLVPLYTAVLTTAEYGAYDVIYSSIGLLVPVLTLNIGDAMLRFPLEEGADVPRIARIGLGITLASGVLVLTLEFIPNAPWASLQGVAWFAPLYVASALYQFLLLLARGCERMVDVAVAGVISAAVLAGLNVALLLVLGMGLDGFFLANALGMAVPALYLVFRMRGVIFGPSLGAGSGALRAMVLYSLPLAMTTVGWWFINASGRYVVTAVCGVEQNGMYSIAFKVPAILTVVAQVFIQAWQVSAIKDFDPQDSDGFLSGTYDTIEMILAVICSVLVTASPLLAAVLFSGEFYGAWVYVPGLLLVSLLNTMGGMFGPFFSAEYDTAPMAASTVLGGAVNVLLGVPLAMAFGVFGMVAANVAASLVNWAYRGLKVRRHISADFHLGRSAALYAVLAIQGGLLVADFAATPVRVAVSSLVVLAVLAAYRRRLREGIAFVRGALSRRRGVGA